MNQRTNTWFSHGSSFFSFYPQQYPLFWPQYLNIVRTKLWVSFQQISHFFHYKGFSYVKVVNLFCVIIGHSQRRPMNLNFSHGRDSPHLLRILIPPLWLWVISIFGFSMDKQSSAKSFDTLKSFKNKLKERDDYFKIMFRV